MPIDWVLAVVPVSDVSVAGDRHGTDPDGNRISFIGGFREDY